MQTPVFKNPTKLPQLLPPTKPLPALAAVSIRPSAKLGFSYQAVYSVAAVVLALALWPWLQEKLVWWGILAAMLCGLWVSFRRQLNTIFSGSIWFEQGRWYVQTPSKLTAYILAGEVVCWSFIVIVPLSDQRTKARRHLVIAYDALSPADNARLRTWLRVCLKPKG